MDATTVGVDLAKNVFVARVSKGAGRIVAQREFNRAGFLSWLGTLPTGTVTAWKPAAAPITGAAPRRPGAAPDGCRVRPTLSQAPVGQE